MYLGTPSADLVRNEFPIESQISHSQNRFQEVYLAIRCLFCQAIFFHARGTLFDAYILLRLGHTIKERFPTMASKRCRSCGFPENPGIVIFDCQNA